MIKGRRKAATDGEVIGMKRAAQVPSLQGRSLYLPFWRISCLFTVVGVSVNLKKWKYLTFVSVYSFMVSVLWWCASLVLYLHVVCCWHFALSLWVSTVFFHVKILMLCHCSMINQITTVFGWTFTVHIPPYTIKYWMSQNYYAIIGHSIKIFSCYRLSFAYVQHIQNSAICGLDQLSHICGAQ